MASPEALKPSVGDGIESSWSLVHTIPLFFLTSLYLFIYLCAPFLVCLSINNNNNNNRGCVMFYGRVLCSLMAL